MGNAEFLERRGELPPADSGVCLAVDFGIGHGGSLVQRILVREASPAEIEHMVAFWASQTPDGELLDENMLKQKDTAVFAAFDETGVLAFLPVQQPLMLENLIYRPGLSLRTTALATARLGEHALEETYRRDAGEAYFLCRNVDTLRFAERHGFRELPAALTVRRLNLRETFGA